MHPRFPNIPSQIACERGRRAVVSTESCGTESATFEIIHQQISLQLERTPPGSIRFNTEELQVHRGGSCCCPTASYRETARAAPQLLPAVSQGTYEVLHLHLKYLSLPNCWEVENSLLHFASQNIRRPSSSSSLFPDRNKASRIPARAILFRYTK